MTRAELESRRLAAVPDLESPMSLRKIADRYGVSRMTAFRWREQVKDGGSLAARRAPGRPRSMSLAQEVLMIDVYWRGSSALGIEPRQWTQKTFCAAIHAYTGLEYSEDHVGVILDRLGLRKRRHHAI